MIPISKTVDGFIWLSYSFVDIFYQFQLSRELLEEVERYIILE